MPATRVCPTCGAQSLRVEQPGGVIAYLHTCVHQVTEYLLPKRKPTT